MAAGSLSPKLDWPIANAKWAATINPVLANPIVTGNYLLNQALQNGANVLNHGLGRTLVGYLVIQNSAAVTFYDSQPTNQQPHLTLVLNASGATTATIYCF